MTIPKEPTYNVFQKSVQQLNEDNIGVPPEVKLRIDRGYKNNKSEEEKNTFIVYIMSLIYKNNYKKSIDAKKFNRYALNLRTEGLNSDKKTIVEQGLLGEFAVLASLNELYENNQNIEVKSSNKEQEQHAIDLIIENNNQEKVYIQVKTLSGITEPYVFILPRDSNKITTRVLNNKKIEESIEDLPLLKHCRDNVLEEKVDQTFGRIEDNFKRMKDYIDENDENINSITRVNIIMPAGNHTDENATHLFNMLNGFPTNDLKEFLNNSLIDNLGYVFDNET